MVAFLPPAPFLYHLTACACRGTFEWGAREARGNLNPKPNKRLLKGVRVMGGKGGEAVVERNTYYNSIFSVGSQATPAAKRGKRLSSEDPTGPRGETLRGKGAMVSGKSLNAQQTSIDEMICGHDSRKIKIKSPFGMCNEKLYTLCDSSNNSLAILGGGSGGSRNQGRKCQTTSFSKKMCVCLTTEGV